MGGQQGHPQVSAVRTAASLGAAGVITSCWRPSPRSPLRTGQGPLEHAPTLRRAPQFARFLTFLFERQDVGSQFWQVSDCLQMFPVSLALQKEADTRGL